MSNKKTIRELVDEVYKNSGLEPRIRMLEENIVKAEDGKIEVSKEQIRAAKSRLAVLKSQRDDPAVVELLDDYADDFDYDDNGQKMKRVVDFDRTVDLRFETFVVMSGLAWEAKLKGQAKGEI